MNGTCLLPVIMRSSFGNKRQIYRKVLTERQMQLNPYNLLFLTFFMNLTQTLELEQLLSYGVFGNPKITRFGMKLKQHQPWLTLQPCSSYPNGNKLGPQQQQLQQCSNKLPLSIGTYLNKISSNAIWMQPFWKIFNPLKQVLL